MLPLIMVVLTNKNGRFGQNVVVVFSSRRHKGVKLTTFPSLAICLALNFCSLIDFQNQVNWMNGVKSGGEGYG